MHPQNGRVLIAVPAEPLVILITIPLNLSKTPTGYNDAIISLVFKTDCKYAVNNSPN